MYRYKIVFLTLLFISWSAQDESDTVASALATQELEGMAHAVNEFGYKLMLEMKKKDEKQNIILSPTGIAGLLAMTLLGSAGSTYDELAKVLGFSQDILENRKNHKQFGDLLQMLNVNSGFKPDIPKIETKENETLDATSADNNTNTYEKGAVIPTLTLYADAIVVDAKTRIRNVYRDYLNRVYHGEALAANFENGSASQKIINEWVSTHTGGKIEEFLTEPLSMTTKVVLLSALYFSGQWAHPFLTQYTMNMTFHGPSRDVAAELMLNFGKYNYVFSSLHDAHMIAFPYNDSTTTMYVMKPFRKKTTLTDLLQRIDYNVIEQLIQNMTDEHCAVRFPKMDLATKIDIQSSLKAIGIKSLFTPGDANFALMIDADEKQNDNDLLTRIYETDEGNNTIKDAVDRLPNPGVYVDSVLHDVKMTVNEYGTVAVAATSGILLRTARLFYADSPFYMFIRNERTKLITFSAVINDPTAT